MVTITWNEQLVLLLQVSLAVTITVLVPIGKMLPLGGVAITLGVLQPPVAETLKNTVAPFEQVATVVILVEQVRLIGAFVCEFTVTWKEQLVICPHVLLAVTITVVIPIGKRLPLGGTAVTDGGAHPPVAPTLKETNAPFELVAVVVMLVEQVRTMPELVTVTVKVHSLLSPQESTAVAVTIVDPIGKVLPLDGLAKTNGGGLQPPLPVTMKSTVAPLELVAAVAMFVGQLITMGTFVTVMLKLQVLLFPHESTAVAWTIVVPIGKVLPLAGLAKTNGGGLQPPLAVTVKYTCAPLELVAGKNILVGH